ncbi:hypothetical protein [uncultured Corynebacterium sp.]|uniref:hypothetical protein n=1 Tax=uncultured Corynebacterium sp. TaxID=159447 RepID=UPI0025F12C6E|nr:hypothetical protein [uncultured Corynebacterium sp.]
MSTWDSIIFRSDAVTDLFEDVSPLDGDELADVLRDACRLASGDADEFEARAGLGAATVAAIWSGAPFSAGHLVDEYPFIREGIGSCPEELREAAAETFETLVPHLPDDEQEAVEDFAEAVN